ITNRCNLNSDFCLKNNQDKLDISINNFKIILNKLKGITKYLYFHVLGETLMQPNVNALIDLASQDYFVKSTANGYLKNKITTKNIRQINVSLHSFNDKYNLSLSAYLNNIINKINELPDTYFSLRLWVNNPNQEKIIKYLENIYNIKIDLNNLNIKLKDKVFLNIDHEFIWPDLNNKISNISGKCYGLISHFGILVDGTIIPCCLDASGVIKLGNFYRDDLNKVLNQERVIKMVNNFKANKRVEELCQKCGYFPKRLV
ncbi:MAG: hypothetical protein GX864_00830, partial [Mollicutes bacterium]|nr:hypothetical protein [Mollicutes bacterium]